MELVFVTEARFVRNRNGVYCIDASMTNKLWERYLAVYDSIKVVARVQYSNEVEVSEVNLASNKKVSFIDIPYYVGIKQYLNVYVQIRRKLSTIVQKNCVYICRVPGILGTLVVSFLRKNKIAYGLEVVGDPWDVFAPGVIKHPLRVFCRYFFYFQLKRIVKGASAVLYVTEKQLQQRYPAATSAYVTNASNVMIYSSDIPSVAHTLIEKKRYELISIGSLAQMYKAPDILIQALARLKREQLDVHVTWLGDGMYKKEMEDYARKMGVSELISFIGNVSSNEVRKYLYRSDIFVLVSRTEGLPRALIEAMSIGLPCIGTKVGGIPELLDKEMLINKNDSDSLASKIHYLILNKNVANEQARRNFQKAKDYYDVVLQKKRLDFYQYLKLSQENIVHQ